MKDVATLATMPTLTQIRLIRVQRILGEIAVCSVEERVSRIMTLLTEQQVLIEELYNEVERLKRVEE